MTIIYEFDPRFAHHLATLLGDAVVVDSAPQLVEQVNTDRDEHLVLFGPSVPLADAVAFAGQCGCAARNSGSFCSARNSGSTCWPMR
ncbi:hypothetical protein ACFQZ4_25575 [Catellatospora coxensis]